MRPQRHTNQNFPPFIFETQQNNKRHKHTIILNEHNHPVSFISAITCHGAFLQAEVAVDSTGSSIPEQTISLRDDHGQEFSVTPSDQAATRTWLNDIFRVGLKLLNERKVELEAKAAAQKAHQQQGKPKAKSGDPIPKPRGHSDHEPRQFSFRTQDDDREHLLFINEHNHPIQLGASLSYRGVSLQAQVAIDDTGRKLGQRAIFILQDNDNDNDNDDFCVNDNREALLGIANDIFNVGLKKLREQSMLLLEAATAEREALLENESAQQARQQQAKCEAKAKKKKAAFIEAELNHANSINSEYNDLMTEMETLHDKLGKLKQKGQPIPRRDAKKLDDIKSKVSALKKKIDDCVAPLSQLPQEQKIKNAIAKLTKQQQTIIDKLKEINSAATQFQTAAPSPDVSKKTAEVKAATKRDAESDTAAMPSALPAQTNSPQHFAQDSNFHRYNPFLFFRDGSCPRNYLSKLFHVPRANPVRVYELTKPEDGETEDYKKSIACEVGEPTPKRFVMNLVQST